MLPFRILALVAVLAIAGCAPTTTLPTPNLTPPAESETVLSPELVPQTVEPVTAESAQAELTRLADAVQALVDPTAVLATHDEPRLYPAADDLPAYFALQRQLSIADSVDPVEIAEALSAVLDRSGWTLGTPSTETGITVWPLASGPDTATWFVFVGGGTDEDGRAVVTLTFGSPDILP